MRRASAGGMWSGAVGLGLGASGLNLLGAETRVIKKALAPGGDSPLHSGVLKPATDSHWICSGA